MKQRKAGKPPSHPSDSLRHMSRQHADDPAAKHTSPELPLLGQVQHLTVRPYKDHAPDNEIKPP